MSINILQVTFFNQYIISPRTWIHRILYTRKIIIIFTYLLLSPYLDYQYHLLPAIFCIIVLVNLPIPRSYIFNIQQALYLLIIFFFSIYIHKNNFYTKTDNHYVTYVEQRSLVKNFYPLNTNKLLIMIKKSTSENFIPKYMMRGFSIYIIYLMLLKILYLTTKYENIITSYIVIYRYNIKNTCFLNNTPIMTLTSQFIILLIKRIDTTIKALTLRGVSYKQIYSYYALRTLFTDIYFDIERLTLALYYKEIVITQL